jgi:hypothetical protein
MKERFIGLIALKLVITLGVIVLAILNLIDPLSATGFALGLGTALWGNWWNWDHLQKLTDSQMNRGKAQRIALSGYFSSLLLMITALGLGGYLGFNLFAIAAGLLLAKLAFAAEEVLRKAFVRV